MHDGELLMPFGQPCAALRVVAARARWRTTRRTRSSRPTSRWAGCSAAARPRLADGSLLGAMHVKDGAHAPALYPISTVDGTPPRVRSLSPSSASRAARRAAARRRARQYAVGLEAGVALVSLGEMDRRMKVAALPPRAFLALARTHMLTTPGWPSRTAGVG